MTKLLASGGPIASTDVYVTLVEVDMFEHPNSREVSIEVVENNTNAIKYKIDGTIDGSNYEEIKAEATLAKNAKIDITPADNAKLKDPWRKIRVQQKADVGGTQGNTTATIIG